MTTTVTMNTVSPDAELVPAGQSSGGTTNVTLASLGAGGAAYLNVGTTTGTVADGGVVTTVSGVANSALSVANSASATAASALQKASNLSDIANASTARGNLGLGSMAVQNAGTVAITGGTATLSTATVTTGTVTNLTVNTSLVAKALAVGSITTPPAIATITGDTGGNVPLQQLLAYLHSRGDIINATTTTGGSGTGTGGSTGGGGTAGGATPMRARIATQRFAVQVHCEYTSDWSATAGATVYNSLSNIRAMLGVLNPRGIGTGIAVLRDDARYMVGGTTAYTHYAALLSDGYYGMPYHGTDGGGSQTDYDSIITLIQNLGAQVVAWEGPLEVDNPSWGIAAKGFGAKLDFNSTVYFGWNAAAALQINMADATIRAGKNIDLLIWSLSDSTNGGTTGSGADALTGLGQSYQTVCNTGNTHWYPKRGAAPFSSQGDMASTLASEGARTDQFSYPNAVTEFNGLDMGDNSAQTYNMPGTEASNALNVVFACLHAIRLNIKRFALYELANTPSLNSPDEENHFGLFRDDGKTKQVAVALHDLMYLLGDAGATALTFTPPGVNFTMSGFPVGTYSLLLAKSDGTILVVVWKDYNIYLDGSTSSPPAGVSSTVTFGATYTTIKRYAVMANASTYAGTAIASFNTIPAPTAADTVSGGSAITWSFTGEPTVLVVTP